MPEHVVAAGDKTSGDASEYTGRNRGARVPFGVGETMCLTRGSSGMLRDGTAVPELSSRSSHGPEFAIDQ